MPRQAQRTQACHNARPDPSLLSPTNSYVLDRGSQRLNKLDKTIPFLSMVGVRLRAFDPLISLVAESL